MIDVDRRDQRSSGRDPESRLTGVRNRRRLLGSATPACEPVVCSPLAPPLLLSSSSPSLVRETIGASVLMMMEGCEGWEKVSLGAAPCVREQD